MANICWFEMRIRGTKENCYACYAMVNSGIRCYDAYIEAENGTDEDCMIYVRGECKGSVAASMVYDDEDNNLLAAQAKKFNIELEVCGLDEGGDSERYHYKGAEVIKEYCMYSYLSATDVEEGAVSEEDLVKYEKTEDNYYVLKGEFSEHFEYDDEKGEAIFDFTMSFRDLPGYEDYDEDDEDDGNLF